MGLGLSEGLGVTLNSPRKVGLEVIEALLAYPTIAVRSGIAFLKRIGFAGDHEFGEAKLAMVMIVRGIGRRVPVPEQCCPEKVTLLVREAPVIRFAHECTDCVEEKATWP